MFTQISDALGRRIPISITNQSLKTVTFVASHVAISSKYLAEMDLLDIWE